MIILQELEAGNQQGNEQVADSLWGTVLYPLAPPPAYCAVGLGALGNGCFLVKCWCLFGCDFLWKKKRLKLWNIFSIHFWHENQQPYQLPVRTWHSKSILVDELIACFWWLRARYCFHYIWDKAEKPAGLSNDATFALEILADWSTSSFRLDSLGSRGRGSIFACLVKIELSLTRKWLLSLWKCNIEIWSICVLCRR